jgi:DNA-binding NtrC family response regulator
MGKKKSILVVDDELSVRESLRIILDPMYEVYTASGGQEAIDCLHDENIDLVTLDLMMPGISGVQVLRQIKTINEDIEVIVVTAYGNAHNAEDIIQFGAGAMIQKPFDVEEVTSTVSNSLERRKNSMRVKSLIEQIRGLLGMEKCEEDEMLHLSKSLCEILGSGNVAYPCSEKEVLNFTFAAHRDSADTQTSRTLEN